MVDLFEKIEKGVELVEADNNPILRVKLVNIEYLLILGNVRMEKACEKW